MNQFDKNFQMSLQNDKCLLLLYTQPNPLIFIYDYKKKQHTQSTFITLCNLSKFYKHSYWIFSRSTVAICYTQNKTHENLDIIYFTLGSCISIHSFSSDRYDYEMHGEKQIIWEFGWFTWILWFRRFADKFQES